MIDSWEITDIQEAVGGYVEHLNVGSGIGAWLNEMGALTLPPNPVASLAVSMMSGIPRRLFGPVVLTGGPDVDGNAMDISEHAESALHDYSMALNSAARILVSMDMHEWAVATLGRPADLDIQLAEEG
jgi:hypothetical protein